jgi:LysR family transcriptional regulator, glycine cleavage system transcriptional activator
MRLPSLDALRVFEAAARRLSFTEAGGELSITQSAVSKQVKGLEEALSMRLFERFNRRLVLTEAGQTLLRGAQPALRGIDDTVAELKRQQEEAEGGGTLTVSTPVSFASLWLLPHLPKFRALHPEIDVRISADDRYVDLSRGHIDIAVRFTYRQNAPPDAVLLWDETLFPVVSPKLLKHGLPPLRTPADLANHVLLHLEDAERRWPMLGWAQWLPALGVPDLHPKGQLHFSQYDHVISAAVEGQGVAIGRSPLLDEALRNKTLVTPFARAGKGQLKHARAAMLITAPHAVDRRAVRAFSEWMLSTVEPTG